MNSKNQKGLGYMTLKQIRVLLGNAEYEITGAAAKESINTMIEQIEESVLNGEEVQLTYVTHKNTGIVYLLCNAAAVDEKKFVCVSLYGSNPKLYSASTIKRMFRKTVETLEVEEEELPEVPAAVDTDDTAADDPEDTEVPAVPVVPVDTEAADKTENPAESDPEVPQTPAAANNKFSREDYKFLEHKTNKLAAEIVKYFINLGYSYQFVSDYLKIHKNRRSIAKVYYTKKGSVRVAINPVCEQAFKSCFPVNYYSFVKAWTLGLKIFISKDENLKTLHKFLGMVDEIHTTMYGKGVSK